MPEIRGAPSARNVAIVLCRPASKSRRTRAANSGSACSMSFHAAIAAVCRSPGIPFALPFALPFSLQVAGGHPAVDQQRGPGDELGLVAGIEHRRRGHVAGLADPADRRQRPVVAALTCVLLTCVLLAGRGQVTHTGPRVT